MAAFHPSTFDLVDAPSNASEPSPLFSSLDQAAFEAEIGLHPPDISTASPAPPLPPDTAPVAPADFWPLPEAPVSAVPDHQPLLALLDHAPSPLIPAPPVPRPSHCGDSLAPILAKSSPLRIAPPACPTPVAAASHMSNPHQPALSSSTAGSCTDGLSAVDRAKKRAEDYTISQLRKKRGSVAAVQTDSAKRRKGAAGSSCSDDASPGDPSRSGESLSHRKYQKRLQKNRDSAFVSRIRRREYTRVLEESLLAVEKEKDAAVASFHEMKQRFEIVSAELSGIKQAASSGLSNLRDSMFTGLGSADDSQQQQQSRHRARPGSAVTMFMFALMFGIMMPEFGKEKGDRVDVGPFNFLSKFMPSATRKGGWADFKLPRIAVSGRHGARAKKGQVWGLAAQASQRKPAENLVFRPAARLLASAQGDAESVLGKDKAGRFSKVLEAYLNGLPDAQVEELSARLEQSCTKGNVQAARIRALLERIPHVHIKKDEDLMSDITARLDRLQIASRP